MQAGNWGRKSRPCPLPGLGPFRAWRKPNLPEGKLNLPTGKADLPGANSVGRGPYAESAGGAWTGFLIGNVVKVITEVSNSAGTRTTAARTITIEEPV